jgi:hypothetical protein
MSEGLRRAEQLARETAQRIAQVAPAGIGSWGPAWERTAAADAAAAAVLDQLGATDGMEQLSRVTSDARGATTALVQAWRLATLAWAGAGSPGAL